jgi:hypothetical protein
MPEPFMAPEPCAIQTTPRAQRTTPAIPRIHNVLSDLFQQLKPGIFSVSLNTDFWTQQIACQPEAAARSGRDAESIEPAPFGSNLDRPCRLGWTCDRQPQLIAGVSLKSGSDYP